jgi:hypothetical protein
MIRNIKALGLAFAAMLCMGAVAASAASAQTQGVLTSDGPVTLTGENTGEGFDNAFTSQAGNVTCTEGTYTGHKVGGEELLESGETTATITPKYVKCQAHTFFNLITLPATVTMNGCDYVFHVGDKTGEHTYGVSADLVCPSGKHVDIHVYEGEGDETHSENEVCAVSIEPQNSLSGEDTHLTHTTEGDDIDLTGSFENIQSEYEGSACGEGTDNEAELHTDVTIEGHNAEGGDTGVTITDE